ncbi:hypothetical protein STEG23_025482 [Scotinomys teguina]
MSVRNCDRSLQQDSPVFREPDPPVNQTERYCLALGEEELAQLRLFCAQRKQKSLGQGVARLLPPKFEGHTCEKCKKLLNPGEYGVFAARAVASPTLETPSGASKRQDRERPQTPRNTKEDSPCPTCSSSSESEPEGFFFGQRLSSPWKTPENLQADDRNISRKHCTIC